MTSFEKYCLRVDDFGSNFFECLGDLRIDDDLLDVTLVSDDEAPIKAHKLVLSVSSLFFRNIFKNNKSNHPILYIRGLTDKDLKNVIEYVYKGEVQVAENELEKFLEVAKDLKLRGMFEEVHRPKYVPEFIKDSLKRLETIPNPKIAIMKEQTFAKADTFIFDSFSESSSVVVNCC